MVVPGGRWRRHRLNGDGGRWTVRRLDIHGKPVYTCEVCGFLYLEQLWAERCQEYCAAYGSCSTEITQHAIQSVELLIA